MSLSDRLSKSGAKPPEPFRPRPELLLQNNTVKPLHEVAPRNIYGKDWWDKTRKAAYRSTGHRCAACGVFAGNAAVSHKLEAHEVYSIDYLLGRMTYIETVPLCHFCHCFVHDGRSRAMVEKGEWTEQRYNDIMEHGYRVLRLAGLAKVHAPIGVMADWWDWRLVLDGTEYRPKYKSYEEWKRAYGYAEDSPQAGSEGLGHGDDRG